MSNKTPKASAAVTASVPKRPKARFDYRIVAILLLLGAAVVFGSLRYSSGVGCPFYIPNPTVKRERVCVALERSITPEDRAKGLSGRDQMAQHVGMLFVFETPNQACMWMKDMKFALDLVWLSEEREIINIEERVGPETYPNSYCSTKPAKYVMELNSGIVDLAGLKTGMKLTF